MRDGISLPFSELKQSAFGRGQTCLRKAAGPNRPIGWGLNLRRNSALFALFFIFFVPGLQGIAYAGGEKGIALFPIEGKGKWGFMDREGKIRIDPKYDEACPFYEGLAKVRIGGEHGYVSTEGTVVIDLQYDDGGAFCGGLAAVEINGKWAYINPEGKMVVSPQYIVKREISGRPFLSRKFR